ncbi:AraC family transcriptional regulator [Nocardioides sp. W3-2-3]|uniref:AraC family transcriptional regulator ligand-binding domain-containing protein n=1 Tax=Nocardioides convexus TaxID=2712224 RepID=UPI0024185D3F|nr:AraC family transcriptional regulator ligand-binding domain-containing protein [Nocardioides convexus]NGZ99797.1 AraC family transcriptional regulator [Nocardioides convexus]
MRNLLAAAPAISGARVGLRYHVSTFGPLGFALLSSPTMGAAANLAFRFLDLRLRLLRLRGADRGRPGGRGSR